jgi:hypothetical protein
MKTLFISWQDPVERQWFPIGRLTSDGSIFRFVYTIGSTKSDKFEPFYGMEDLDRIYESKDLFPLFSNKLLSKSRPEFSNLLNWLRLDLNNYDPIEILSLTGGRTKNDSLEIFPCPTETTNGEYEIDFFSRGLSHEPDATQERVDALISGEKLYLMKDVQNEYDEHALLLRTDDPVVIVGYCPRYLANDLNFLLEKLGPMQLKVTVNNVNRNAPFQLRLLCKINSPWPKGFNACSDELYAPMAGEDSCKMR